MLDPRPRTLATAAGVVLVGALTALGVTDPEPPTSRTAGSATDAGAADSGSRDARNGDTGAPAPDDPAPAGKGGTVEDAPSGKGGGSPSPTERTLQQMRERDLSDAVDTYQDLGRRD